MTRIGYITYQDDPSDPDPDLDIEILVSALNTKGYLVTLLDWMDANDVKAYDALLMRSPWNYTQHLDQFRVWLSKSAKQTQIINPLAVIESNIDKGYLLQLQRNGIPIIPTKVLHTMADLDQVSFSADRAVFKPIIGAGARGAFVAKNLDEAVNQVAAHFQKSSLPLLSQPYLAEVDTHGEIAVVCCNGEPLHAVYKRPALSDGGHGDFARNAELDAPLIDFINQVLEQEIAEIKVRDLFYARVDVVPTAVGYLLMELELFEPTLFLAQNPSSAEVFAEGLKRHLA